MADEEHWMARALTLAEASLGLASPNPQVGCVLVREGQVLGEGAHHYDRFDHAEIAALKQAAAAGHDVHGATAYVTLEPCSHHGRTGPCADALIAAGIARCVVATLDPNPEVSGRGLEKLRTAGIQVSVGTLQARARALNNAFACSITRHRPFVTLKAALSADGKLAPPTAQRTAIQPFWLTGPQARAEVQLLRHASDALLVGIGTVLADNPLLTGRSGLPRRRPLQRIVLDTHLRTPLESQLVQTAAEDVWLFCGPDAPAARLRALEARGLRITPLSAPLSLRNILSHLHEAKLLSLLLETGPTLNGAFLREQLVDRIVLFYAETELGPNALPFAHNGPTSFALEQNLLRVRKRNIAGDAEVTGLLRDPWQSLPPLN